MFTYFVQVLISVTTKDTCMQYFNPYHLLPTECLSCLIDILNDSQTMPTLAHKAMVLLNNLGKAYRTWGQIHLKYKFFQVVKFNYKSMIIQYHNICL